MTSYFMMSIKNTLSVWKAHNEMLKARRRFKRQQREMKMKVKLWKYKTLQKAFKNL